MDTDNMKIDPGGLDFAIASTPASSLRGPEHCCRTQSSGAKLAGNHCWQHLNN